MRPLDFLERKIPPLMLLILTGCGMWIINILWLPGIFPRPISVILMLASAIAGVALMASGVLDLRRAGTTPNPITPEKATSLVTTGIFARTRNPIYLGMLLLLIAWALYLRNPLTYAGPLLFVPYMNRFQIRPEERALSQLFGAEFKDYKMRVGRWI